MTAWTEQQRAIPVAEWGVVGVSGYGIGRWLLLREADIVLDAVFLCKEVGFLGYLCLEQLHVLVTDGEVYVSLAIGCSIKGTLYQMLLHRCACTLGILVEQQQALWQLTVVQSLGFQHVGCYSLIVALGHQGLDAFTLVLQANSVECLVEGKVFYLVEVFLLKVGSGHIVVGVNKSKHVFEHTTGGTTGGHKLYHALACCLVIVPCGNQLLALGCVGSNNTVTDTCSCLQLQEWETCLKLVQLIFDLLLGDTFLSNLLQVFLL